MTTSLFIHNFKNYNRLIQLSLSLIFVLNFIEMFYIFFRFILSILYSIDETVISLFIRSHILFDKLFIVFIMQIYCNIVYTLGLCYFICCKNVTIFYNLFLYSIIIVVLSFGKIFEHIDDRQKTDEEIYSYCGVLFIYGLRVLMTCLLLQINYNL